MKPKTNMQKEVFRLSKTLSGITNAQKKYAIDKYTSHLGIKTSKGIVTCLDCANKWKDTTNDSAVVCPHCGRTLEIKKTRHRVVGWRDYYLIVTICGGYQVLRYFMFSTYLKAGQKADYSFCEVAQWWINNKGKYVIISRKRGYSNMYYDMWLGYSPMEVRSKHRAHIINCNYVYNRERILPIIKRNGYSGNSNNFQLLPLFLELLSNPKAETLIKAKQYDLLKYSLSGIKNIYEKYWRSICIAMRNNYIIGDATIWLDYIELLEYFGKDTHNAHYVCPLNLNEEHDRLVKKKMMAIELEKMRVKREKAYEAEQKFIDMKQKYFGLQFSDGNIVIKVLESVKEFLEEGQSMHHCVFSNEYYLKPNSLILSATIDGKRIETIEVSLKSMQVIQSRGICNKNTEYHDDIIALVNKNMKLIRQRKRVA
jgi:hypothetical protein